MTEQRRAPDVDGVAVASLRAALSLPGILRAGLALTVVGGRQLRFLPSDQHRLDASDWCLIDAFDRLPLNDAIRTGRAVVVESPEALAQRYPELALRQSDARSVLALPLGNDGLRLGGLLLYADHETTAPTDEQLQLASHVTETLLALRSAAATPTRGTYALPDDATAPGQARLLLRQALTGAPDDVVDAALLCISELVTNVVMHAGRRPSMDVELTAASLTVHVHHDEAETGTHPPKASEEDPLRISGRGLELVDALASAWGTETTSGGTTTWFRLDL